MNLKVTNVKDEVINIRFGQERFVVPPASDGIPFVELPDRVAGWALRKYGGQTASADRGLRLYEDALTQGGKDLKLLAYLLPGPTWSLNALLKELEVLGIPSPDGATKLQLSNLIRGAKKLPQLQDKQDKKEPPPPSGRDPKDK